MAAQTIAAALSAAVLAGTLTQAQSDAVTASYNAHKAPRTVDNTYLVPGSVSFAGGVLRFREAYREEAEVAWHVSVDAWTTCVEGSVPL